MICESGDWRGLNCALETSRRRAASFASLTMSNTSHFLLTLVTLHAALAHDRPIDEHGQQIHHADALTSSSLVYSAVAHDRPIYEHGQQIHHADALTSSSLVYSAVAHDRPIDEHGQQIHHADALISSPLVYSAVAHDRPIDEHGQQIHHADALISSPLVYSAVAHDRPIDEHGQQIHHADALRARHKSTNHSGQVSNGVSLLPCGTPCDLLNIDRNSSRMHRVPSHSL
ncbi:hypothetical protein J6590_006951 [Homalodisca vitripennis]|nr:hypothetical protein J6590_006951 [Homalodisca vitripennis]